ncbi:MAG: hypothetical protein ACKOA9_13005 [Actinomycetota bacterium]
MTDGGAGGVSGGGVPGGADPTEPVPKPAGARRIETASWGGNLVFAATSVPVAAGVDRLEDGAIAVCLVLFLASLVIWVWALAAAFARSARGEEVAVSTLFLLEGAPPRRARRSLYGALGVCLLVTAVTAAGNPFGVLVPMYPLGLVGLWGARHGAFPPRRDRASR